MNNPKLKGYGFKPSDQILIGYLRDLTLFGRDYLVQDIIYLGHDICNYDPWDLPINVKSIDDTQQVIGIKTRLYFKHNSCPNKTTCMLHQFELVGIDPCQDKYFLGKVIMKEFKPTNISSNNIDDRISIPQVRVELGPEPSVETQVTNEYEWTQSEQTNQFITSYPVFDSENFIDDGNEVISYHQSQVRVELGSEPLVETEVANEYGWTQSEQTNEFITPRPVFDIDDGNEVISNHQSQINMELIRSLEVPNIGIEDQNQSYKNIGIDNDRTVPDGSNQHNIVAAAENESSILPSNLQDHLIDFINHMEWSDLYNLCRRKDDGLFLDELFDEPQELGPQNQCGINQQVAAGAEIECTNLPPLDVAESSYSTDSVRKRLAMEVEGSGTGVETELAQQQAKRSRS
ncbi:hypothetical protein V6Z11_A02G013500 [Gossypium hirsutum]